MMEDKILWTARYAEGDMEGQELADFQQQLETDPELQAHLKDYMHLHQSLKMHFNRNAELEANLKTLNQQYFSTSPKIIALQPYLKWMVSAAAILVIGLLIWAPWNRDIYSTYRLTDQMMVTERGSSGVTLLEQAAILFNNKEFTKAQPLLANLFVKEPHNAMVAYYYGLCLIETAGYEKARAVLNPLHEGESVFKYDATYSIALSYLKEKEYEQCKTWLQKIPKDNKNYIKASSLMDKL